jgi:hypothetical protein
VAALSGHRSGRGQTIAAALDVKGILMEMMTDPPADTAATMPAARAARPGLRSSEFLGFLLFNILVVLNGLGVLSIPWAHLMQGYVAVLIVYTGGAATVKSFLAVKGNKP